MKQIQLLTQEVVNTIAAGEVIQRPTHVLKELIENSLDAQAREITILLQDAGMQQIDVIDDGQGIHPDDLNLAVTPHATSKLRQIEDFTTLKSQGFRGEALASIAQVSQVLISSRLIDHQAGYTIQSTLGQISAIKPIGMPVGTRVTVKQLFAHSPVRQEFLNQSKAELRSLLDIVTSLGLARPEVGFCLKHNGREILRLSPKATLLERTTEVFGKEFFSQLLPFEHQSDSIKLTGFISQPALWTKRPSKQYLFVNQRPVKHIRLQKHLHQLVHAVRANNLYPLYSLYLEVTPSQLDVNIHPQKSTIEIFNLDQLKQILDELIPPLLHHRPITYATAGEINYQVSDKSGVYKTHRFRQGLLDEYHQTATQQTQLTGEIQQLENLYLLAPTNTGLLLIDQHALHERLLYDELKSLYQSQKSKLLANKISVSLAFDLSPEQTLLLEENLDSLRQLGIDIEPFGSGSFKVNSVPELLADHNLFEFITEMLDHAAQDESLQVDSQTDALLASMACRLAVKAGDSLSIPKRIELVNQLLEKSPPGICPHGRPVAIKITLTELNKLFKRS